MYSENNSNNKTNCYTHRKSEVRPKISDEIQVFCLRKSETVKSGKTAVWKGGSDCAICGPMEAGRCQKGRGEAALSLVLSCMSTRAKAANTGVTDCQFPCQEDAANEPV